MDRNKELGTQTHWKDDKQNNWSRFDNENFSPVLCAMIELLFFFCLLINSVLDIRLLRVFLYFVFFFPLYSYLSQVESLSNLGSYSCFLSSPWSPLLSFFLALWATKSYFRLGTSWPPSFTIVLFLIQLFPLFDVFSIFWDTGSRT